MSRQHEMPDLFGRITLVLDEHPTLRNTVEQLWTACATITDRSGPPAPELLATVSEFADTVLAHFEVEERPEYFGELVEESPTLREPIAELKAEHQQMRSLLEELRTDGARADAGRFATQLEHFLDRLAAHERRETALLEAFFLGDSERPS